MAVIEFDIDGTILKANQNFLELMGYKLEEIAGENHRIFVSKDERNSEAYRNHWKELASGHAVRGDFKQINKHGEEVWLKASYSPVRNKSGAISKVMKIAYDITALKTSSKTKAEFASKVV